MGARPDTALGDPAPDRDRESASIATLVSERAARSPENVAIEDGERRLTYAELSTAGDAIAAEILAAGAAPEEAIGVVLPRSWQAICAFLGVLRAGCAYVPISPAFPVERRRNLAELAGVRVALAEGDEAAIPGVRTIDVDTALDSDRPAPPPAPGGDRLAYVLFTSGTTGEPKGVEITHANVLNLVLGDAHSIPREGDANLHVGQLGFDITVTEIWGGLLNGSRVVVAPAGTPDPARIGRLIAEREVTVAFVSPGLLAELVRFALPELGGLEMICAGGDVLQPALVRELRAAHPHLRIANSYGPTETTVTATEHEVVGDPDAVIPIGRALAGYDLHVLGPDDEPVADGRPGGLWIAGAGVARGYRGDPERTAECFRPLPGTTATAYRTGDRVMRREDGEIVFLGREDDQVKISGQRVEPAEVGHVLASHPRVLEAVVVAREDVPGHKRLVGYFVPRPGEAPTAEQLRSHVAESLPAFMVPAVVVELEKMPRDANGKIDRRALPRPKRDAPSEQDAGLAASVMVEVLGLERIGPDENFFELGGSSLLAIQLVGRLRERTGIEIGVADAFEYPTPAALERVLAEPGGRPPALPPLRPGRRGETAPLSRAQRRAWIHDRINPDSVAYQFATAYRMRGELDVEALRTAMDRLVDRHEILRTSFEEQADEPVQRIHDHLPTPLDLLDLRGKDRNEWARVVRERVRERIPPDRLPLLRWTLMRTGEAHWILLQIEHHLIHDGWSFTVFAEELAELYVAAIESRPADLPEPAIQFQDYARWEREAHRSEAVQRQLEHWKLVLDPDPGLIEIPAAKPRPAQESFRGGSVRRRLPADATARLREFSQARNATLFMVSLAAFLIQLHRYGGATDLQVGSGVANRRDPRAERLIGMMLNTVTLRCNMAGDPTVDEVIQRVRATALDAYANADAPFDAVVDALGASREPGRSPLIQTLFSFHDAPRKAIEWPGLEVTQLEAIPNGSAKADINVIGLNAPDGGLTFVWEHSEVLDDATADRLASHHLRLIAQLVENPSARISELELIDEDEAALLRGWSRGDAEFDRGATIAGLVGNRARSRGDAIAVVDPTGEISYAELMRRAASIAGGLRGSGVEPGDRVGVLLPRGAAQIAAMLGTLLARAAYVPLDPGHPPSRMLRSLHDAGAGVVLTDPELGPAIAAELTTISVADALTHDPIEPAGGDPDDLAYLIYTSGSTGEPKGVEVTNANVVRLVDDPAYAELGPGTVMLHASSPAFDAATLEVWGPLANGGTVVVLPGQPSPPAVAEAIEQHAVTTLWLTAGLFHELVDTRPGALAGVRHVLAGGDVLSPSHVARALAALPADGRLTNGYGPTETTTFALTHTLRPGEPIGDRVPIGTPIQGTTCDVVDARGHLAPIGVAGELRIGGDGVARGYHGDPELTASRFVADPLRPGARAYLTGDRVRRRADGTIEFIGREDRQVKVRGFRVEPAEVERVIRSHARVDDVAVATFERSPGDLALAAYIVARDGEPAPTELRELVVGELPAAMVPAAWIPLAELPLTANGKVDRAALPAPGREHLATAGGAPPRGEAEQAVVGAFEKVLEVEGVGADDDFFALGGHSLLAIALFVELERQCHRRLPLATIFEASTPRALAALIGSDVPASRWDNLVPLKPGGTRPPLFVVSAGDGNLVGFGPLARHLSADQPLYGLQPSGLDGRRPLERGIEAMADAYLEKIRQVHPEGPYLLAGRCNGATIAYEIAQRLRAEGRDVPLYVSLDSDPPPSGPEELLPGIPFDEKMEYLVLRGRELGEQPPDPESPEERAALAEWLRDPIAPGVSRYLHAHWLWRDDLQSLLPDPLGEDAEPLSVWAWDHGVHEGFHRELLLPAPTLGCGVPGGRSWDLAMAAAWESLGRQPRQPLDRAGWAEFRQLLREPVCEAGVTRYLAGAAQRPDLAAAYPDPTGADAETLVEWSWHFAIDEGLDPSLLPPSPVPLTRWRRLELALTPAGERARRTGQGIAARARGLTREGRDTGLDLAERRLGRPLPAAFLRTQRHVVAAALRAKRSYRAEPWAGEVVLITSREYAEKPANLAWDERALGGVRRFPLDLGHIEMLREPGAKLLAACVEERIAEALRR